MADKSKAYRVRLSTDVVPEQYDLRLEPDVARFTFDGNVKVTCDVAVATDTIAVNTKDLLISSASFTPTGGETMAANEITTRVREMTTTFVFGEVLPVGKGVLEIVFRGTLNDQMAGFYRSKYTSSKGEKLHMAVTQFEAIDARRCFPCWDEPGIKAVFVVTMVYPNQLMALSNMPSSRAETLPDGRRCETFMPTPKMSTYLLAFCVGEYEFIAGRSKNGVICRVLCPPGNTKRCEYALSICTQALDFYDNFFGIPYPLPKLDMIAIPDFSAGAMENWGLVTYREVDLLCDVATVSAAVKKRICTVITHELAHQWFGNLVTMEWWDDLWLNEGFANWMQTFAADALCPQWNIWEAYVAESQAQALRLDALRSSHPIQVPIGKAEQVEEVFDAISYCKGGAVVRMIYAVLGEEKFQEGLRIYFNRHKYGNTETTDLWKAWVEASGKPVDKMMGSWTEKMGFPMLKVLKDPFDGEDAELEVEQSWFLADGSVQAGDEEKTWVIPVLVGSDKRKAGEVVFVESKKQKMSHGGALAGASWLKLNFGQHVPVRVLYPASMIARLSSNIASLPVEDRIGLLSDTFALGKAGSLELGTLVTLVEGFKGETNDKVWSELSAIFGGLDRVIKGGLDQAAYEAYVTFVGKIVYPAFQQVGWDNREGEDDNRKKLRATLVSNVAKYCAKNPEVSAEAVRRCAAFLAAPADPASLDANIRSSVLCIAMQAEGFGERFELLVGVHASATDAAVKKDIYGCLACAPAPELVARLLEWSLTDEIRSQDLIYIPMFVSAGAKDGAATVWAWTQSQYDRIHARLGATSMILFQNVVRISGSGFVTEARAEEVRAFWEKKPVFSQLQRAVQQTVEGIVGNAKFVDRLKSSELKSPDFWVAAAARV